MYDANARLAAKVKATNIAHAKANELYPLLRPIFEPLVGKTINKTDNTMMAKFVKLMPEIPSSVKLMPEIPSSVKLTIYRSDGAHSLAWCIRACESDGNETAVYCDISLYIGHMRNGVLERLYDAPALRADYTADEVKAKRAAYVEARKAADNAFSALHPFGDSDR